MSDTPGMSGMDPTDLWRQWYEMGSRMWQGPMQPANEGMMDPMGMYRQWFEGMENVREQTMQAMQSGMPGMGSLPPMPSMPALDGEQAAETWRKAVDAAVEGWQKSADMTNEMVALAPRWQEMVEQARDNLLAIESFPTDPLEFAVQWYNATSGPYSDFVQELIERDEFLAPASQFLQNYASLYKVFKKNSEEYLKTVQIPTRSDITRIASLIVALEEKVDNIEEALEDLQDAEAPASAPAASDDRTDAIEKRLDGVEKKLDRLLSAMENVQSSAQESTNSANGNASSGGSEADIKATAAARRKAQDLGVDLASVNGTGADGQITVEDVRKKGDA